MTSQIFFEKIWFWLIIKGFFLHFPILLTDDSTYSFRDRPFNLKGGLWFFVLFRNFFWTTRELEYLFFFVAQSAIFFFQNSTLGNMTKTLNHIYFLFLHQNQNIFFSNIRNKNIFLEKNHNPPPSS